LKDAVDYRVIKIPSCGAHQQLIIPIDLHKIDHVIFEVLTAAEVLHRP
jgi:hypothetical protein